MCFSAEASFTAGALLSLAGLVSMRLSRTRANKFLATIPVFFAAQQILEGILWLTIPNHAGSFWYYLGLYGFLIFAFTLWPVWVPYTMSLTEKDKNRKKIMQAICILGLIIAGIFIWHALRTSFDAQIYENHIQYLLGLPTDGIIVELLSLAYLICVVGPFLLSTKPHAWLFGLLVLIACGISYYFYYIVLVSVWCFFAAILSGYIVLIILQDHLKRVRSK